MLQDCDGQPEDLDCCGGGSGGAVADFFRFAGNSDVLPGYVATATDAGFMLNLDLSGGGGTVALPAAAGVLPGTIVAVRKTDATNNAGTVIGQGGDTVSGPVVLSQQYECLIYERRGAAEWVSWANEDGYIHVNLTDGSIRVATGGNARGAESRDFQQSRALAAQVASGARSAILNGQNNKAAAADSTAFGRANTVDAPESAALSGNTNTVSGTGYNADVAGLGNNVGTLVGGTQRSVNLGGNLNAVDDNDAANVAGNSNAVAAPRAANVAGNSNSVQAPDAANLGGTNNDVNGPASVNLGGDTNIVQATADNSGNVAGTNNNVSADRAANVAGNDNEVSGAEGFNGGGDSNVVSGVDAGNVGGITNAPSGLQAFNGGGQENTPSADNAANIGGTFNDVAAARAANIGGNSKTLGATAVDSVALGGDTNVINGARAVVLGGQNNQLDGDDAAVMGSGNYVAGAGAFATGKDAAADRPGEFATGAGSGTQGAAQGGTLIYSAVVPGGVVTELDIANVAGEYLDLLDGDNYAVQVRTATAKVGGAFSAAAWFANAANAGMIWRDAGVTAGLFSGPQLGLMNDALNFAPTLELFADVANNRLAVYIDNTTGPDAFAVVVIDYAKRNG
jgi:hypothetical protein